ncbi:MAG: hypothetical protein EBS55_01735 [Flavobacteriaceae bacterium]|nr:hypothetical protein [Flavobacteriaceae bacterium]
MYFDFVKIIKKIVFLLYNVQSFNFIIINVNLPTILRFIVYGSLLIVNKAATNFKPQTINDK